MSDQTVLDYEVFEHLKRQLGQTSPSGGTHFSEWVLGYGFRMGITPDEPVSFVLLCNPQTIGAMQDLLQQSLPEGQLTLDTLRLPVQVCITISQHELTHALTKPDETLTEPPASEDLEEWVQVSLGQTLREVILQDHRKIILPAYLLRYTPFTSPNLIILRAALSQIHYLHQAGASTGEEFEQRSVSARMSEITRWSSFSRTSIYRLLHEDPRSPWLVTVENKGSYQNDQGQQISQPNEYLLPPLHLTPGDAVDLLAYLKAHQADWASLDDCLIALAKCDPHEVLAYPYRTPQEGDAEQPMSVLEVIRMHFGPFALNAERLSLLDKVRDNLIGTDFVAVPWYVLRSLLPVYGASIITLYLMCQPLLYRNGRVQRDTFWLPGGNETLCSWTNDRSIGKYFPKANNKGRGRPASETGSADREWRKNKREMLADFFLRVDTRKDDEGQSQWKIQVNEPPILPADEHLMSSLYAILADLTHQDRLDSLFTLFERDEFERPQISGSLLLDRLYRATLSPEEISLLSAIAQPLFSDSGTPVMSDISNFETPEGRLISLFEPPVQQLISENATPVMALISEFETHLKILFRIKDSIKIIKDPIYQPDSQNSVDPDPQNRSVGWDLNHILQDIRPEYKTELMENSQKLSVLKAWLIRNCLNGKVFQPLNLAITQTLQNNATPDAAAQRLAEVPPGDLLSLLEQMRQDPASLGYLQDLELRAWVADLQLLMMGEDAADRPVLLQRLIDLLEK